MNWKILVSRYLARKYKLNESNLKMHWRITDLIKRKSSSIRLHYSIWCLNICLRLFNLIFTYITEIHRIDTPIFRAGGGPVVITSLFLKRRKIHQRDLFQLVPLIRSVNVRMISDIFFLSGLWKIIFVTHYSMGSFSFPLLLSICTWVDFYKCLYCNSKQPKYQLSRGFGSFAISMESHTHTGQTIFFFFHVLIWILPCLIYTSTVKFSALQLLYL